MMKKVLISIAVFFIFPIVVLANEVGNGKNVPLVITANRVRIQRRRNTITFYNNVIATQNNFTLLSDKMVVFYREDRNKKISIEKIEAQNNVKFLDGVVIATGDIGWYELGENKIILKDNIKATEKGITLTADRFEYDILTGKTKIIGNNNPNERVTIILDNIGAARKEEEPELDEDNDDNKLNETIEETKGEVKNEGN